VTNMDATGSLIAAVVAITGEILLTAAPLTME
jgi:hypothetical protein